MPCISLSTRFVLPSDLAENVGNQECTYCNLQAKEQEDVFVVMLLEYRRGKKREGEQLNTTGMETPYSYQYRASLVHTLFMHTCPHTLSKLT
jgi:hypothetical protein